MRGFLASPPFRGGPVDRQFPVYSKVKSLLLSTVLASEYGALDSPASWAVRAFRDPLPYDDGIDADDIQTIREALQFAGDILAKAGADGRVMHLFDGPLQPDESPDIETASFTVGWYRRSNGENAIVWGVDRFGAMVLADIEAAENALESSEE